MRGIGILILLFTFTLLEAQDNANIAYQDFYFLETTFANIPTKEQLTKLEAQGIELTTYLGDNRYKTVIPESVNLNALNDFGITSYSEQRKESKIEERLLSGSIPAYAKRGSNLNVAIVFNKAIGKLNLEAFTSEMGISVIDVFAKGQIISVETSKETINRLSEHPLVSFVNFITPELEPLNYEVGALQGAKYSNSGIHGVPLNGKGVVIGVGDGGQLGENIDLQGFHINEAEGTYSSYGSHGDHVSGTIAGRGLLNPRHKGVASQATLVVQKTQNIIYNAEDYYNQYNMVLTNNSYGVQFDCEQNGAYNYTSFNLDKQLREVPQMLHCFAAGNNGANVCGDFPQGFNTVLKFYGAAKNVLTVGAVDEEKQLSLMSSKGPVADGRIKPEIVGVGVNVISTGRDNNYFLSSGTSMSTPAVTGCLALMYEKYELINNTQPYGDLMKAIICNSANDLGNRGPDYEYGFGMANVVNALDCIENKHYIVDEIYDGEEIEKSITVPAGLSELKIMNYWHDHESEAYPTIALINNLDLMVVDPNGKRFYPLVLDPSADGVDAPAKQGLDNLNNIEQVSILDPIPGTYKLVVKGKTIPFGGQRFNLVYDFLNDEIELVHPVGNESFIPGNSCPITWNDYGSSSADYTIDFSIDGGQTWHLIGENITSSRNDIIWTIPETFTTNGFVRVIRSGALTSNIIPFNILERPENVLAIPLCEDVVNLSWDPGSQTSSTEVFMYENGEMKLKGTTDENRIEIEGNFEYGETYWFAVQGVLSTGHKTARTVAVAATFDEMTDCPRERDIKLSQLSGISTGRALTATSLTNNEKLDILIKNIGREDLTEFDFHVSLNDEVHVDQAFGSVLYSGMELNFPFSHAFDLTEVGSYEFDAWIDSEKDMFLDNNSLLGTFKVEQLANEPVELPYRESFSNAEEFYIHDSRIGLMNLEKWDYINGGAELNFINTELNGGNHSLKLNNFENSTTQAIMTINASDCSIDKQVFMNFKYKLNQLSDLKALVYLRGNDADDWIQVAELDESDDWQNINEYNVTSALLTHGQLFSTSTQIKFVLMGEGNLNLDDIAFENVPLAIEEMTNASLEVFPNPFTNKVQVSLESEFGSEAEFKLYDASGLEKMNDMKMLQEGFNYFSFDIDSGLPAGMYFLKIQIGSSQIIRKISKHLN